jgi:hypothetical protein
MTATLSPPLSRPITRTRRRRKPTAFHAYIVPVNDDGYPRAEPPLPAPAASLRPARAKSAGAALQVDRFREARIRFHSWRVAHRVE